MDESIINWALILVIAIIFVGVVILATATEPTQTSNKCTTYDSPNYGDEEMIIGQQRVCEEKGYAFSYTPRKWDQCQGKEIHYSSRCVLIENNTLVNELIFDNFNGQWLTKEE